MCLSTVYRKHKRTMIAKLPESITGFKMVRESRGNTKYEAPYQFIPLPLNKICKFKVNRIHRYKPHLPYIGGCHIFLSMPSDSWIRTYPFVKATFQKKDIKTIGRQHGVTTVTVSKAKFTRIK